MLTDHDACAFRFALNRLDHPLIIVDLLLAIRFANYAAERLLQADDGVMRWGKRLSVGCRTAQRRLEQFARCPDPLPPDLAFSLPRPASNVPLFLSAARTDEGESTGVGHLLITLHEAAPPDAERAASRLRHLGLTNAEARVAGLAAQALEVPRIAARLGVSPNTVKAHLKSAYGKLGVSSRVALARLAAHPG